MRPGKVERRSHDYVRHGTTTLFAALDVATGEVTGRFYARHRREEFLGFLQRLARVYTTQEPHLIVDNYRTRKHPVVRAWLADNPRIPLHFTPIGGSWMNQVETWFSILQRRVIARGVFRSLPISSWPRRTLYVFLSRCNSDLGVSHVDHKRQTLLSGTVECSGK